MKHILPILAFALLGTATTASAAYYYDDVYGTKNPTSNQNTVYDEYKDNGDPVTWTKHEVDTVTYTDFQLSRITQQNTVFSGSSDNFYLIRVTGKNVKLYLTDYVDNIQDREDGTGFNSNSIANMGVAKYGYRLLDADGNVIGDTQSFDVPELSDLTAADVIDSGTVNDHVVNRYKYELGTFKKDTYLEVYLLGDDKTEAYSYNPNPADVQKTVDQGGFADGYTVSGVSTDKLLTLYYGKEEAEARKAMPLAELAFKGDGVITQGETRVHFAERLKGR